MTVVGGVRCVCVCSVSVTVMNLIALRVQMKLPTAHSATPLAPQPQDHTDDKSIGESFLVFRSSERKQKLRRCKRFHVALVWEDNTNPSAAGLWLILSV